MVWLSDDTQEHPNRSNNEGCSNSELRGKLPHAEESLHFIVIVLEHIWGHIRMRGQWKNAVRELVLVDKEESLLFSLFVSRVRLFVNFRIRFCWVVLLLSVLFHECSFI